MKKIFSFFLLYFVVNAYSDVSNYEVGDVFESKKRTTSVVLYKFKADLLMLLSNTHQLRRSKSRHDSYPYSGSLRYLEPRYKYDLQKGDKIILLDRLEEQEGEVFRVALIPKRKAKYLKNPYYFVLSGSFNQLVFVEHLNE